ncbi:MAG: MFS transporter [Dehalococcoidia bacterium]
MTPGAKEGQSVFGDFLAGIRHLVERPQLLLLSLGFMGFVIAGFSYQVVVPAFVELELGRDQGTVGLLYGVSGIAGLAVSVGIAGVAGSKHAFVTMTAAGVVVAVGLALFAVAGTLWLAAFALVVVGAGSSGYQLLQNALLMEAAAPEYYGRVMSVVMLAWGVNGLVAWPFGALADAIGERETLAVMAALTLLVQAAVIAGHTTVGRRGAVAGQPAVDFAGPGNDG